MILGGSTNAVLHIIAIAHSVGIKLSIDDFQTVSDRIPFLADLKPSGKYVMEDVFKIGGIPSISLYPYAGAAADKFNDSCSQIPLARKAHRWKYHDRHRKDIRGEP